PTPGRVLSHNRGRVHKGLILKDQGNSVTWQDLQITGVDPAQVSAIDEVLLDLVAKQVSGSFAGVDVQAGDAKGMVVIEHEPGALLVVVVKGQRTVAGVVACHTRVGVGFRSTGEHISVFKPHVGDKPDAN